jgi:hypothetical protein
VDPYTGVFVNGLEVFAWHDEMELIFLFLFTEQEVNRTPLLSDRSCAEGTLRFTATASVLRDRLRVLGVGHEGLEAFFTELLRFFSHRLGDVDLLESDNYYLLPRGITLETWADLLAREIASSAKSRRFDTDNPGSIEYLLEFWADSDPRLLLAAVLEACRDDDEISLVVADRYGHPWGETPFDPQTKVIEHYSYSLANGRPPVVITEGSTDAQFLQAAIRIRYPHLQSFIKFLDFGDGAEGSAAAGVRTLKSFAAAGISNRVVLLLDNDTAARDALRALRGTQLPRNYSVLHYPEIDLARSYPTLGPDGVSWMDVNGLAGSIELYLGADVLNGFGGNLSPVQWRSYIEGTKAYQGEVLHKADIQKRYREKVKAAEENPELVKSQDWSNLDAIIASLIERLSALDALTSMEED